MELETVFSKDLFKTKTYGKTDGLSFSIQVDDKSFFVSCLPPLSKEERNRAFLKAADSLLRLSLKGFDCGAGHHVMIFERLL